MIAHTRNPWFRVRCGCGVLWRVKHETLYPALVAVAVAFLGAAGAAAQEAPLDVDANGVVNVATDVVYVARHLTGLDPVPESLASTFA